MFQYSPGNTVNNATSFYSIELITFAHTGKVFCAKDEFEFLKETFAKFLSPNSRNLNKDFRLLGERNFAKVSAYTLYQLKCRLLL